MSQPAMSGRLVVAVMPVGSLMPGRKTGFSRDVLIAEDDHQLRAPQCHRAIAGQGAGQCRAPGAGTDHAECGHAFTPAPAHGFGTGIQRPARAGGGVKIVHVARPESLQPGPGDHRAIVGAQPHWRGHEGQAMGGGKTGQCRANGLIGGDPAGDHQRGGFRKGGDGARCAVGQAIAGGLLEAGGEIGDFLPCRFHNGGRGRAARADFRPAKEKCGSSLPTSGRGRAKRGVPFLAARFQRRAARKAQAQHLGGLVESFAHRIVDGRG